MKIGILAVQGAFAEHKAKLEKLGAQCIELRKREDLDGGFDGLVLPGHVPAYEGKNRSRNAGACHLRRTDPSGRPSFQ